jgi:hypothetical protein
MSGAETVGQRFAQLISYLNISKNAFAASLERTATVVQHLVDERNKPGFDLMSKVLEVYPNVSADWLLLGNGPMMKDASKPEQADSSRPLEAYPSPAPEKKKAEPKPTPAMAAESTVPTAATIELEKLVPAEEQPSPVAATPTAPLPLPTAPSVTPVIPDPATVPAAPSTTPAADTSWQTALYTQQMAHQLAMAELRNQHLQEQQRLMQQMLDLMQRQLVR